MILIENPEKYNRFRIAIDSKSFIENVETLHGQGLPIQRAYEKTEQQVIDLAGIRKFSDYESFARVRRRHKNK